MELTILQSIIFGVVQGVTEFLPISSSGHLVILQDIMGINQPHVSFFVALHIGSLLAVIVYFWNDWLNIFHLKKDMSVYRENPRLLWYIIVATIPAAIVGFFFNDRAESLVFPPIATAFLIVIGSFILFVIDWFFASKRTMKDVTVGNAIVVGLAQILALIPGVSRSGMTIAGGRMCQLSRDDAARFSFLIATPIIAGAGIMQLGHLFTGGATASIVIGMVTTFFAAIGTIHYFLIFIKKVSYVVFLYYALILFTVVSIIFLRR